MLKQTFTAWLQKINTKATGRNYEPLNKRTHISQSCLETTSYGSCSWVKAFFKVQLEDEYEVRVPSGWVKNAVYYLKIYYIFKNLFILTPGEEKGATEVNMFVALLYLVLKWGK